MATRIWATDGGIYFGYSVGPTKAPADQSLLDVSWEVSSDKLHLYPNPNDPENRGDWHILTVGPNGSGKTRRLLIPNLFRLINWSIVIIDIKGELAALTAAFRSKQDGHRILVIDPFKVMQKNYPKLVAKYPFLNGNGFNPLTALSPDSDEFPDDALAFAEALIRVEGQEPHWSQSAQDLIAAFIMYVRLKDGDKATLAEVRALLGQPASELRKTIKEMMIAGIKEDCEELTIKAGRFEEFTGDNKELNSILSTALTQTRWLDSRPIKADLSKDSFDTAGLKQSPTTIYLILPPRYLVTHSTWLRVMITAILLPLLRSTEDTHVPVLFMLDEFAQLGRVPVIENNMALMRGFGLKLWPVFQDLAQAQDIYEKRWESFAANAGVLQSFAPQDATTREYLSRLSGQRLYWLKTGSTSTSMSYGNQSSQTTGSSEAVQYMPGPVFWPQGLGSMDLGQAVLFSRGRAVRAWLPDPEDEADQLGLRRMMQQARQDIGG